MGYLLTDVQWETAVLKELMRRVINVLEIEDPAERNEVAARILSIRALGGRTLDEIVEKVVALHKQLYAPGSRRQRPIRSPRPRLRRLNKTTDNRREA